MREQCRIAMVVAATDRSPRSASNKVTRLIIIAATQLTPGPGVRELAMVDGVANK